MRYILATLPLVAILGAGCSTPQVARDQANHGAALTAALESELREFRRVQLNIAQNRLASVREQRALLAAVESNAAYNERVLEAAGRTSHLRTYGVLQALADSRGKDEVALQAQMKALDESLAKVLSPLPDNSEKLKATQASLSAMSTELSTKDRVETFTDFAKIVKKTVDENRKKIREAEAGTEQPPRPNAPLSNNN